jgi:hypothetical protein
MTLTGSQVREARVLLGWTRGRLAGAARVSTSTIAKAEHDGPRMTDWAKSAIRETLEAVGIVFEVDGGVTLRGGK